MAEVTESFINGFVGECYRQGFSEKQAAALLEAQLEREEMQKQAGLGSILGAMARHVGRGRGLMDKLFRASYTFGLPAAGGAGALLLGGRMLGEPLKAAWNTGSIVARDNAHELIDSAHRTVDKIQEAVSGLGGGNRPQRTYSVNGEKVLTVGEGGADATGTRTVNHNSPNTHYVNTYAEKANRNRGYDPNLSISRAELDADKWMAAREKRELERSTAPTEDLYPQYRRYRNLLGTIAKYESTPGAIY